MKKGTFLLSSLIFALAFSSCSSISKEDVILTYKDLITPEEEGEDIFKRAGKDTSFYTYKGSVKTSDDSVLLNSRYTIDEDSIQAINNTSKSYDFTDYSYIYYTRTLLADKTTYTYLKVCHYYDDKVAASVSLASSKEEYLSQLQVPSSYYKEAISLYHDMLTYATKMEQDPQNGYSYSLKKTYVNKDYYYYLEVLNTFSPSVALTYYFQYQTIDEKDYLSNISYKLTTTYASYYTVDTAKYIFYSSVS